MSKSQTEIQLEALATDFLFADGFRPPFVEWLRKQKRSLWIRTLHKAADYMERGTV